MATIRAALAGVTLLLAVWVGDASSEPLSAVGGGLAAAPRAADGATAQRLDPQSDRRGPGAARPGVIDRASTVTDMPSSSRTIELLLEMQGKNPGLEGGERPKVDVPSVRKQPSPTAAGSASPPFGAVEPAQPFGGSDTASNKARAGSDPQAVDWNEPPASRFGGGGVSALGGGAAPLEPYRRPQSAGGSFGEDDVRWLIPRAVVRFVRQNRDMVIVGSMAVLGLLWGAATLVSGARRK